MKTSKEEVILNTCQKVMKDLYSVLCDMSDKQMSEIGRHALDFIADYPIYASSSNITYENAIMIAIALGWSTKELITGEEEPYVQ